MRGIVVYDSNYGNTRVVAENIAKELGRSFKAVNVKQMGTGDANLVGADLLVVGSPINMWDSTKATKQFLKHFGEDGLYGIKAAAFDTRLRGRLSGSAARKMSRALERAGAEIIAEPMGFYVRESRGPLLADELSRVERWAREIKSRGERAGKHN